MKHELTTSDILPYDAYERVREERRGAIVAKKKNRRLSVGPYATFYFENFDTMWLQVQEMLRIEKGGAEQLKDELLAYNPLVPKGHELVATMMLEIEDPDQRQKKLAALGGIEHTMELRIGSSLIKGEPESDLEYTSPEGKASSVQFVHFRFTSEQILLFRAQETEIIVAITHPNYGHMAVMPQPVRKELAGDFDV